MSQKKWLALAAALCGLGTSARADEPYTQPPVWGPISISAPVVQFVDNHQQADSCRSGLMIGGEIYILRPFINDNTAFVTTVTNPATATSAQVANNFNWDYEVAPAAWLGWTSPCGVGFRARYFIYDHKSEGITGTLDPTSAATTTISPPPGLSPPLVGRPSGFSSPGVLLSGGLGEDNLTVSSNLKVQTIDGEVTYAHEWCHFGAMLTVGGRYLQISQNYHATLSNVPGFDATGAPLDNTAESSFLNAGHNFYGGGPTLSLMSRWQFGRSGLSVFGSCRGSLLIGKSRLTATFSEKVSDPANPPPQDNVATTHSEEHNVLPIGELEGGLEYSCAVGRTRLFVRGAAVNHTYFNAGNASARDTNLSLFGGQVTFGVNY